LTILLITHNIGVVAEICDRVAVMYAAKMAEVGSSMEVFTSPKHPYTQGLLNSVPNIDMEEGELYKMGGEPPNLLHPPHGCRFHPRCPFAMEICSQKEPPFREVAEGQSTACWLYEEEGMKGSAGVREVIHG
jgi:oligopeptide/dipeptide ABC transporter ATP-binding protein